MIEGQTKQFDTFDNREDRRELVILFQKLGEGLPETMAREVRAKWLEMLICLSMNNLDKCPIQISPERCSGVGAFQIFTQIVGVLGVPIADAAKLLDNCVRKKGWLKPFWIDDVQE